VKDADSVRETDFVKACDGVWVTEAVRVREADFVIACDGMMVT
jgi:hypothetical protein